MSGANFVQSESASRPEGIRRTRGMAGSGLRPRSKIPYFFFSSRRRHTRFDCDWSSDVCSSDLVEHVTRGTIYPLFTAEDVLHAEARAARHPAKDFGIEAWDAGQVRDREPALASRVRGAMFVRGEHWVNNQRLVVAYAQAAVAAGVVLRAGLSVSRVVVEAGRAHGVVADGEHVDGDVVLLAAGAWTGQLVASFGARLPVEPRRGQMLALTHVPAVLHHCVHTEDVYLVPRPSGELLVGATVERVGFQGAVTAKAIAGLLRAAIRSEEHTSELQSQSNLVCRLLLEKKNTPQLQTARARV